MSIFHWLFGIGDQAAGRGARKARRVVAARKAATCRTHSTEVSKFEVELGASREGLGADQKVPALFGHFLVGPGVLCYWVLGGMCLAAPLVRLRAAERSRHIFFQTFLSSDGQN
jgi:hypothetical protein